MNKTDKTVIPPPLNKGDIVGIAAPAGPIEPEIFRRGVTALQECGLVVRFSDDIVQKKNYLAGSDSRRLQEFHRLWSDPEVKAIIAARGGYGSGRLLENLDFELIRRNPKILVGFSDLTIMLNAITGTTGLVTYHGPMLSTLVRDGREALHTLLDTLCTLEKSDQKIKGLEILRNGQAEGPLVGGNLASLMALIATPFEPNWDGAILFVEEIHEAPYRVDRMLTNLKMSGRLNRIAGIILGDFLDKDLRTLSDIEQIWQRTIELTTEEIPVWANFPVGHGARNIPLPLGHKVRMNSNSGVLQFYRG